MGRNTWTKEYKYTDYMKNRISCLISEINLSNINSFMDLGCGMQWAREFLPKRIKYFPVDALKNLETTIVKDFNQGEFLEEYVDICMCSGVIEYIYDIDNFISNISKYSNYVIGSYHFREDCPEMVDPWVNRFTLIELMFAFEKRGFVLEKLYPAKNPREKIFVLRKSHVKSILSKKEKKKKTLFSYLNKDGFLYKVLRKIWRKFKALKGCTQKYKNAYEKQDNYGKGKALAYVLGRKNLGDVFNHDLLNSYNVEHYFENYNKANIYCIGSILERLLNKNNEIDSDKKVIVAGSGFIKEQENKDEKFASDVEILALRGELSKQRCENILDKKLDITLGDPGLLASKIYPLKEEKKYDVGIIPHYYDECSYFLNNIKLENKSFKIINVQRDAKEIIKEIQQCKFILSSAMHGLIIADSYGIANRRIKLTDTIVGGDYKFKDYYSIFSNYDKLPKAINLENEIITDSDIEKFEQEYRISQDEVKAICEKLDNIYSNLG